MKRYEIKIGEWTESILLLVIIAVVWSIWGTNGETNTLIMPSLKDVFQTFCTDVADGSLLAALGISMKRVLTGYVISAVLGIGLGIVIGLSKHMQRLTNLVIQIIRPIPPIAWIPLVILWM